MKQRTISVILTAAALLFSTSLSFADDDNDDGYGDASIRRAKTSTKSAEARKSQIAASRKAAAKIQLVDINSAKKAELIKLPGISIADADKIIAGRPYGSKAWLVTHKILPDAKYQAVQGWVVAKQPFADGNKNAALYAPKN